MQWNPAALFTMPPNKHKNVGQVYIGLIFFTQFKNLKKKIVPFTHLPPRKNQRNSNYTKWLLHTCFHPTNPIIPLSRIFLEKLVVPKPLILTLLKCRIWWAPNNVRKWQMAFNSALKGLKKFSVILWKPMVRWFTAAFTITHHFSLEVSQMSPVRAIPSYFLDALYHYLYLLHISHPRDLASSVFPTTTVPHTSSISLSFIWLACNYFLKLKTIKLPLRNFLKPPLSFSPSQHPFLKHTQPIFLRCARPVFTHYKTMYKMKVFPPYRTSNLSLWLFCYGSLLCYRRTETRGILRKRQNSRSSTFLSFNPNP